MTPSGTTGEGVSVGAAERLAALDAFTAAEPSMERVALGLAAGALEQARAARERGVGTALLPPSFYYAEPYQEAVQA